MVLVATLHTGQWGLRAAVVFGYMTTTRTGAAGLVRWHRHQHPSRPLQFVFQWPPKLAPTLIKDRAVETQLGLDPRVFDTNERVVLADRCRGFLQEVFAAVGYTGMDFLDFGFFLFPFSSCCCI